MNKYIRTTAKQIIDNTKGEYIVKEMLNRDNDKLTIVAKPEYIHENYVDVEGAFPFEKQADTIEELCDVFVYVKPKNAGYDILPTLCKHRENDRAYIQEGYEIYGAIWTDEGLIYKAKMKGVLSNGEIDWELL